MANVREAAYPALLRRLEWDRDAVEARSLLDLALGRTVRHRTRGEHPLVALLQRDARHATIAKEVGVHALQHEELHGGGACRRLL